VPQGGGLGSGLFSFAISQVFGAVLAWVTTGTAWLLGQVGKALEATTEVNVNGAWFSAHLAAVGELAGLLTLPLLLVAVGHAVVRQDASMLLRVLVVQLPLAFLASAAVVEVVQLSLAWVDSVSGWVAGASSKGGLKSVLDQVASGLSSQAVSGAAPMFVALMSQVIMTVGAFALWIELAVRGAAIYLAVLFVPLVIAGTIWPATARYARRLTETIAALVLSKLVMVGALSLAAGALSGVLAHGELGSLVDGLALLLLAVFAPYSLLRLMPFVEAGAVSHLEGTGRRLVGGAVGLPSRALGAMSAQVAGEGEVAVATGPFDHAGSDTPSHLEAILGRGPGDGSAGGWHAPPGPGGPWPPAPGPVDSPPQGLPPAAPSPAEAASATDAAAAAASTDVPTAAALSPAEAASATDAAAGAASTDVPTAAAPPADAGTWVPGGHTSGDDGEREGGWHGSASARDTGRARWDSEGSGGDGGR
jgi:hypothetical protein